MGLWCMSRGCDYRCSGLPSILWAQKLNEISVLLSWSQSHHIPLWIQEPVMAASIIIQPRKIIIICQAPCTLGKLSTMLAHPVYMVQRSLCLHIVGTYSYYTFHLLYSQAQIPTFLKGKERDLEALSAGWGIYSLTNTDLTIYAQIKLGCILLQSHEKQSINSHRSIFRICHLEPHSDLKNSAFVTRCGMMYGQITISAIFLIECRHPFQKHCQSGADPGLPHLTCQTFSFSVHGSLPMDNIPLLSSCSCATVV
jgi:hypothetical protein